MKDYRCERPYSVEKKYPFWYCVIRGKEYGGWYTKEAAEYEGRLRTERTDLSTQDICELVNQKYPARWGNRVVTGRWRIAYDN